LTLNDPGGFSCNLFNLPSLRRNPTVSSIPTSLGVRITRRPGEFDCPPQFQRATVAVRKHPRSSFNKVSFASLEVKSVRAALLARWQVALPPARTSRAQQASPARTAQPASGFPWSDVSAARAMPDARLRPSLKEKRPAWVAKEVGMGNPERRVRTGPLLITPFRTSCQAPLIHPYFALGRNFTSL